MSWPLVKLRDCCEVVGGATPKREVPEYWDSPDVPWVTPKDVSDLACPTLEDAPEYISEAGFKSCSTSMLPKGSVLVTSRAPIGNIAIAGRDLCTNQGFKSLIPSENVDGLYLYYCMKHSSQRLQALGNGATFKEVSKKIVEEFEIPLPPLHEQRRIAAILDKADAIRRKRQQAIQLADDFLRAVFLDMFGDPATNPKGWPVYKMSEVIDFKGGSQPPKETFEYEEREGYIRLVQIRDFRTEKFKTYIPEHLARRRFEVDDVMIGRYGPPVFQILRGLSGSYNVALMKAMPKYGVTKDFIYRLLQLPTYQDAVISNSERTAGQTGVNLDLLNSLDVPLPPLEMQVSISKRIRKTEALLSKLKLDLEGAEQLFYSLSQKAFSGKL